MKKVIRIGTRGSLLAWTQSGWVKDRIEARHPGLEVELVKIVTKGDKILDVPLAQVGGKGLFVKEIEEALLRKEVDIAVHSMKDVPADLPTELHLGLVTKREDPRDAFISNRYRSFSDLPVNARVGTSSLRRRAQLIHLQPGLAVENLRGNLDTRLRKLDENQYDAIIVAVAGLKRLGLAGRVTAFFPPQEMLPAIGQGALGIEMRREDDGLLEVLSFLNDPETAVAVRAERGFLSRLEGGCQVPIGAFGQVSSDRVTLTGMVAAVDGSRIIKETMAGTFAEAESLGVKVAEQLLGMGGKAILEEVYGRNMIGS